ncbi:MAG: class I SAM-dependent methyltransferase [Actinomycetota bacterium]
MSQTVEPHPGGDWFAAVGDFLGAAYLRYAHTRGTTQEVDFLIDLLELSSGARVLDVGCGAGRHALDLARRGLSVTAIDISRGLLDVAADEAKRAGVGGDRLALFECDARAMPFSDEFDAVISLCQGGFGLLGAEDPLALRRMTEALRGGGRLALTAFSAYYEAAHPRGEASLVVDEGFVRERTKIVNESGEEKTVTLWTGVYTPRELRLLALGVGLKPEAVWSVEPGNYARRRPDLEHVEFMLYASKPSS